MQAYSLKEILQHENIFLPHEEREESHQEMVTTNKRIEKPWCCKDITNKTLVWSYKIFYANIFNVTNNIEFKF